MIRNVVVHLLNEQPIMADLVVEPKPTDVSVICCNLRTMAGEKPGFVDRSDSTFVIPLTHVRFMEIRAASMDEHAVDSKAELAAEARAQAAAEHAADPRAGETDGPESATGSAADALPKRDPDEIDPDLLRRVHDA